MRLLFIGDIFGKPGRTLIKRELPRLRQELALDICLANCENAAQGSGITEDTLKELFSAGIDAFTGGNHLWDKKQGAEYLKTEYRIARPLNFPKDAFGQDIAYLRTPAGKRLAIISLCGQVFLDTPFPPLFTLEEKLKTLDTNLIFVDFHAEATGEKRALGFYFDGKVSAIIGTHTHIQTADEEILPQGTAYLSDVGMTGPHNSVIGVKKEIILQKMLTGMPIRFEPAEDGLQLNAVLIDIDEHTGKATSIQRVRNAYE